MQSKTPILIIFGLLSNTVYAYWTPETTKEWNRLSEEAMAQKKHEYMKKAYIPLLRKYTNSNTNHTFVQYAREMKDREVQRHSKPVEARRIGETTKRSTAAINNDDATFWKRFLQISGSMNPTASPTSLVLTEITASVFLILVEVPGELEAMILTEFLQDLEEFFAAQLNGVQNITVSLFEQRPSPLVRRRRLGKSLTRNDPPDVDIESNTNHLFTFDVIVIVSGLSSDPNYDLKGETKNAVESAQDDLISRLKTSSDPDTEAYFSELTSVQTSPPGSLPSATPSRSPSFSPSTTPSASPSTSPSGTPSVPPSASPSSSPSAKPSAFPSAEPSAFPSASPSEKPSSRPSTSPSAAPSVPPSVSPSVPPSTTPSIKPSAIPSAAPSGLPSKSPTVAPGTPTASPSSRPTGTPSLRPSRSPSTTPSSLPSALTSEAPVASPSETPSAGPSRAPSSTPTTMPSARPSSKPSISPSRSPSSMPSASPSSKPSTSPSHSPSAAPSSKPSESPSAKPSSTPSSQPSMSPTTNPVRDLILENALFDGMEFDDPDSYQSQALNYMLQSDLSYTISDARILTRYSLACIYYSVFTQFSLDEDWLTDVDECQWHNVACTDGSVAALLLNSNALSGTFPPEVVFLKDTLSALDLSNNVNIFTSADVFNEYLGQLTKLNFLVLDKTNFTSTNGIPTELALLTDLLTFTCSESKYTGPLDPAAFQASAALETIDISFNLFDLSTIPSSIGSMTALKGFFADSTFTQGTLDFFEGSTSLEFVWVDNNPVSGSIPTSIYTTTTLQSLSVSNTLLAGELPLGMPAAWPDLSQLILYNNSFTGGLPTDFKDFTTIDFMYFEFNAMTTPVDHETCTAIHNRIKFFGEGDFFGDCCICPTTCCLDCEGADDTCPFQTSPPDYIPVVPPP